jgi:hypothetical protein
VLAEGKSLGVVDTRTCGATSSIARAGTSARISMSSTTGRGAKL